MKNTLSNKTVEYTYSNDLCCSCGICAYSCPKKAIDYSYDEYGYLRPMIDAEKCVDCGKCVAYCPGIHFFVHGDSALPIKDDYYFEGYSLDSETRINSASGGLTTELLVYLINNSIVDYCIVVQTVDPTVGGKAIITNEEAVIRAAKGSKYCPVSFEEVFDKIDNDKKYAIVALPCQIQALSKLIGDKRDNFVFVALFCNHCSSLNATKYLCKNVGENIKEIMYRGDGWPGKIQLKSDNNQVKKIPFRNVYIKSFGKYFYNTRCRYCNDPFGAMSDISVADAFHRSTETNGNGQTLCFVHSKRIKDILFAMRDERKINISDAGKFEDIILHFPSQKKRTKNAIAYIKAAKKYDKKILPIEADIFVEKNSNDVQELSFFQYYKQQLKIFLYKWISKHECTWGMIFRIKKHREEIEN